MEGPCRGKRDSDARSVVAYKRNSRAPQSGQAIKAILLCVFYSVRTARSSHRHEVYKFVGPLKDVFRQSIARALGQQLQRIALGFVRDEAEIRGHRRTYVTSGPGVLANELRKAGLVTAVWMLFSSFCWVYVV